MHLRRRSIPCAHTCVSGEMTKLISVGAKLQNREIFERERERECNFRENEPSSGRTLTQFFPPIAQLPTCNLSLWRSLWTISPTRARFVACSSRQVFARALRLSLAKVEESERKVVRRSPTNPRPAAGLWCGVSSQFKAELASQLSL